MVYNYLQKAKNTECICTVYTEVFVNVEGKIKCYWILLLAMMLGYIKDFFWVAPGRGHGGGMSIHQTVLLPTHIQDIIPV